MITKNESVDPAPYCYVHRADAEWGALPDGSLTYALAAIHGNRRKPTMDDYERRIAGLETAAGQLASSAMTRNPGPLDYSVDLSSNEVCQPKNIEPDHENHDRTQRSV